jgi:branched-chain amino acid aminotransferase
VEVREIVRSELIRAQEAFLCGTSVEIAPLGQIDGKVLGDGKKGPITSQIQKSYFELVYGLSSSSPQSWFSKVPIV